MARLGVFPNGCCGRSGQMLLNQHRQLLSLFFGKDQHVRYQCSQLGRVGLHGNRSSFAVELFCDILGRDDPLHKSHSQ